MRSSLLAAVVILVVAAAALVYHDAGRARDEYELRADSALAVAGRERTRARAALAVVDSLKEVNVERGRMVRERVAAVRSLGVPDSCAPFVVVRDQIIDTLIVESDSWRLAAETARASVVGLAAVSDSLAAVLKDRPKPRPPWAPQVGAGPFLGLCADGRPCAGLGLTLSWRIR